MDVDVVNLMKQVSVEHTSQYEELGLAIAKSFTEAQKGDFKVDVDGDLFKVTIFFCRENRINA